MLVTGPRPSAARFTSRASRVTSDVTGRCDTSPTTKRASQRTFANAALRTHGTRAALSCLREGDRCVAEYAEYAATIEACFTQNAFLTVQVNGRTR